MDSDSNSNDAEKDKVIPRTIEDEMKKSYIDYSMSVIIGRALPDVRDGLKPVHRRILYAMHEAGIVSSKPHKKSARIVGDVLGKYHPHGDAAVYDTMVRMAQDFSLRYPLIDGQGNFGSVDGDSAAAMRYTESRMAKIAEELLVDIEKDTVKSMPNYDGSMEEPTILPGKLPNLLINGSSGIAVGMATNIPPHNIGEIVDGIIKLIDEPDTSVPELMHIIKGPDFPTAGIIQGIEGIRSYYETGRGRVRIRSKTNIEEEKGMKKIIVTEIPYQVNKATLIESIAQLVKDKKIEGIKDLRDESDREGMRIVIELKKDVQEEIVLNQLCKHTQMEASFGVIMLALVDNQPRVMNIVEVINHYISHRKVVIRRRTEYDLKKAEDWAHILEGLIIALDNIDAVIKIIRESRTVDAAKTELMQNFSLSELQSKAILDMKLSKLTGLEIEKVKKEYDELLELIKKLKEILASEEKILNIIKEELLELKKNYSDARRTKIDETAFECDIDIEDLIPDENVAVMTTNTGYIKRLPVDTYSVQKRGGKGLMGMATKEEDFVVDLFIASTHDYIMFFTNKGRVFWLKTYRIPEAGRQAKGKAIINLLPLLEENEKINSTIPVKIFDDEHYLVFATKQGIVKKTTLSEFKHPRITGIRAITLDADDEVISTMLSDGICEAVIATKKGQACRFNEKDVRTVGRSARGVRGIRLNKDDEVVAMALVKESDNLLTITENGFGKQSKVSDYRKTKRGGKGVKTIVTNERNGSVVSVMPVCDVENEFIITSTSGMVIRIDTTELRVMGRNTMGVRIMRLEENDKVVSVARFF